MNTRTRRASWWRWLIATELVCVAAAALAPCFAQSQDDLKRRFEEAEKRIVHIRPEAFPALPGSIVRELQRRGCGIPQEAMTKTPHNVIRGEFAKRGQTDVAVLCSVNGVSTILVFWNGSVRNVAAIGPGEDRGYLQTVTATDIGFSRAIQPVGKNFIMRHYREYGGPKPPPIDHQGIDDAFVGKASVTWYFHAGKWMCLSGAD